MPEESKSEDQDWLVPAILVAVIVTLGLAIGIGTGVRSADRQDVTIAGQLERWSSCLRSEGANVPLVESLRDGGFRVTVDGSLLEDGLDRDALRPALEACEDEAPERIRRIVELLNAIPKFPIGDGGFGAFDFGEAKDIPPPHPRANDSST